MSVYFIRNRVTGNIKIGYTGQDSAKVRFRSLQDSTDCDLEILAIVRGADRVDEGRLHHHFRETHVVREWFAPSDELHFFIDEARRGRLRLNSLPKNPKRPGPRMDPVEAALLAARRILFPGSVRGTRSDSARIGGVKCSKPQFSDPSHEAS